jgi:hypothetical protein
MSDNINTSINENGEMNNEMAMAMKWRRRSGNLKIESQRRAKTAGETGGVSAEKRLAKILAKNLKNERNNESEKWHDKINGRQNGGVAKAARQWQRSMKSKIGMK